MRAGLSVPERGNVMVARGDRRRRCPGGWWLDLRHHHCLVRDPRDTVAALFLLIYSYIWEKRRRLCARVHEMKLNELAVKEINKKGK